MFSTWDQDNSESSFLFNENCAVEWQAAWWFNYCSIANPNGLYKGSALESWTNLYWSRWKDFSALKGIKIMVGP
jgi:hypothetical protein